MGSWESARHRKVGRRRGAAGGGPHGSPGARARPRWPVHLRPLPSAAMATPIRRRPGRLGVREPAPFLIATGVGPCGATHPAAAGAPRRPRARAIPHCHGRRPLRCDPSGFGHGPLGARDAPLRPRSGVSRLPCLPFGLARPFALGVPRDSASAKPSRRDATPFFPQAVRGRRHRCRRASATTRAPRGCRHQWPSTGNVALATGSEHLRWLRGDRDRWPALGIGAASQVMCTARPIVSMVWSA